VLHGDILMTAERELSVYEYGDACVVLGLRLNLRNATFGTGRCCLRLFENIVV